MQRLHNGVRFINGAGPCLSNVQRIDAGAMPMIQHMSQRGLQVDLSHFAKMEKELALDMDRITEDVNTLTGHYINLDSGDQIAELLFKKLKLKQARPKLTTSGDRESVEDEVLTAIQHDHPCIPKILEYKEFSKLSGTYVKPMPKLAVKTKFGVWRMYPNFNTTRVPSGRLSCKKPNLLAMPTRTARGRQIREGFITDPGWCYVSVDESQIEVRIAAHCSQDENLLKVYHNEEDIYSDFATAAFKREDKRYDAQGVERAKLVAKGSSTWVYPTVDKNDHRRPAKTCVLASIYDVSSKGLLEQMPIVCGNCKLEATKHTCSKFVSAWSENKCQDLINAFYLRYPGLMSDRKKYHQMAKRHGFVWDMWGRILHVQAVRSVLNWVVSAAMRECANFPYQSGAQGTIKLTMAALTEDFELGLYEVAHPLLQVHDELVFECREDVAEELIGLCQYHFANCVRLSVDIKSGGATAPSWGLLEK